MVVSAARISGRHRHATSSCVQLPSRLQVPRYNHTHLLESAPLKNTQRTYASALELHPELLVVEMSENQLSQFDALAYQMKLYAGWVAVASAVGIVTLVTSSNQAVSLSKLSHTLLRGCSAILVWQSSNLLPGMHVAKDQHLCKLMQWLRSMDLAFAQMCAFAVLAATVAAMEAAVTWPGVVYTWALVLSALALVRFLAQQYVTTKYPLEESAVLKVLSQLQHNTGPHIPWYDRVCLLVVAGYLLVCYDLPASDNILLPSEIESRGSENWMSTRWGRAKARIMGMGSRDNTSSVSAEDETEEPVEWSETLKTSISPSKDVIPDNEEDDSHLDGVVPDSVSDPAEQPEQEEPEFEFTRNHERMFAIFMDGLRNVATWTAAVAVASLMTVTSHIALHGVTSFQWMLLSMDALEAGMQASLMLYAMGCFSRIISTEGHDMKLLMEGISSKRGVTALFGRLYAVQRVTAMIGIASFIIPKFITRQHLASIASYIKVNGFLEMVKNFAG